MEFSLHALPLFFVDDVRTTILAHFKAKKVVLVSSTNNRRE
jgi:hypothetical protein